MTKESEDQAIKDLQQQHELITKFPLLNEAAQTKFISFLDRLLESDSQLKNLNTLKPLPDPFGRA